MLQILPKCIRFHTRANKKKAFKRMTSINTGDNNQSTMNSESQNFKFDCVLCRYRVLTTTKMSPERLKYHIYQHFLLHRNHLENLFSRAQWTLKFQSLDTTQRNISSSVIYLSFKFHFWSSSILSSIALNWTEILFWNEYFDWKKNKMKYFEKPPPYLMHMIIFIQDPDTQVGDFQRKLELINSRMTNDRQYRQVQHLGNCKYWNSHKSLLLIN